MNIFKCDDYKTVLREKIKENQSIVGYKGRLAKAAGCQRAYLSQVLNSHIHLTPDHAAALTVYWSLTESERDYFLELVNLARAATPALRQVIVDRLETIKKSQETVTGRIKKAKIENLHLQGQYYSSWHFSAIHILITISGYRTVNEISRRLNLSEETVASALAILEQMGLAKQEGKSWLPKSFDLHLPKRSPLTSINHMNWRQRAVLDAQSERSDGVHFTAVYSVSESDFNELKHRLLQLVSEGREIALKSPEEELVAFTCDLFRVD